MKVEKVDISIMIKLAKQATQIGYDVNIRSFSQ